MSRDAIETMQTSAGAPITFKLQNPAGQSAVYIGDPKDSVLTLTLTNESGHALLLSGAAAVPPDPNHAGTVAALYLDFGTLFDKAALEGLALSGQGWRARRLDGQPTLWGLCPAADTTLAKNGVIAIRIDNVVVSKLIPNARLTVFYVNFDKPKLQSRAISLFVKNPPGTRIAAPLTLELKDKHVRISPKGTPPIQNTLTVELTNGDPVHPIKAGPASMFYLSFVYGEAPGDGALTREDSPLPDVTVALSGGDGWDVKNMSGEKPPYIALRPTGANALGTGTNNKAVFTLERITVPSDFAAGPTSLFVHYVGLPGYQDDYRNSSIEKVPAKPTIDLHGSAHVDYGKHAELSWSTVAVPYLQLSYKAYGKGWVRLPAHGDPPLPLQCSSYVVPDAITQDITFDLAGYDTAPNANGQPGTAKPLAEKSHYVAMTYPPPCIQFKVMFAQSWPFVFGPHDVLLAWDIEYPTQLKALTLTGFENLSRQPGICHAIAPKVTAAKTWKLTATGQDGVSASATATIEDKPLLKHLADHGKFSASWDSEADILEGDLEIKIRHVALGVIFDPAGQAKVVIDKVAISFSWPRVFPLGTEDADVGKNYDFGLGPLTVQGTNVTLTMQRIQDWPPRPVKFQCHPDHVTAIDCELRLPVTIEDKRNFPYKDYNTTIPIKAPSQLKFT